MGVGSAEELDLNTEEGIKELRTKLFGGLDVTFDGIARVEGTYEGDLAELTDIGGPRPPGSAPETFYDFRSWVTTKIRKGKVSLVFSLDIAGDDFSDPEGAILGNGGDSNATPGGPAVVRESGWDLRTRHLYLNYNGWANFSIGRLPLKLGNGIAVSTIRDAAKIVKPIKPFALGLVIVKGGETMPNTIPPDPDGTHDNDLDAYVVFAKYKHPNFVAQLGYGVQDSTIINEKFPEKQILNFNLDGAAGNLSYAFEGTYLGGESSFNPTFGDRLDNKAFQAYGRLQYNLADIRSKFGIAVGYGTGDNDPTDGDQEDFQSFFMNSIGFHIAEIYGNDIHSYDAYIPGTPGADGTNAGAGFANTTFVQVSAAHDLTSKISLNAVASYFVATEDQLVGEGVLLHPNDGTAAPGETEMTDDIGWEIDVNGTYKVTDYWSFYARFGFFSAGDIWGRSAPDGKKAQAGLLFRF